MKLVMVTQWMRTCFPAHLRYSWLWQRQFIAPLGVAIDSSSNLYVVDAGNRNIQIFGIDTDGDGVPDHEDNSPTFANPDSEVVVQICTAAWI